MFYIETREDIFWGDGTDRHPDNSLYPFAPKTENEEPRVSVQQEGCTIVMAHTVLYAHAHPRSQPCYEPKASNGRRWRSCSRINPRMILESDHGELRLRLPSRQAKVVSYSAVKRVAI